jgi:hypothetical protein
MPNSEQEGRKKGRQERKKKKRDAEEGALTVSGEVEGS